MSTIRSCDICGQKVIAHWSTEGTASYEAVGRRALAGETACPLCGQRMPPSRRELPTIEQLGGSDPHFTGELSTDDALHPEREWHQRAARAESQRDAMERRANAAENDWQAAEAKLATLRQLLADVWSAYQDVDTDAETGKRLGGLMSRIEAALSGEGGTVIRGFLAEGSQQ